MTSNIDTLDLRFRTALRRMKAAGRLRAYAKTVDTEFELAAIMKKLDGEEALLFTDVKGHAMPVIGNFLGSPGNCEAAFGADAEQIRGFVERALGDPKPPAVIENAPAHEVVHLDDIDIGKMLPVMRHTRRDAGRFITAGIVVFKDPDSGIYNASYHRLQLLGGNKTAIKLDYGRHLRLAFERSQARGQDLAVAVCLGTDVALHFVAATMGSQLPEDADELAVAGGLAGRPMPVVQAKSQDLLVPADTEIVLEGTISAKETVREGPFGEFIGLMSPEGDAPIVTISALTHRKDPIYYSINGYARETVMLRKYVMEATLLKVLRAATPIVKDAEMTPGGLHRFNAVISVEKTSPGHEGLQRNAMLAAFGALKDLDLIIMVDDDIDIRDPMDVEYALAMRFEASKDVIVIPGTRAHEMVRASNNGIRAKLGLDATVPVEEKAEYTRLRFEATGASRDDLSEVPDEIARWFER